jgi:heat shock protein 5
LNKGINPDEAVAYGAATQASVLAGGDDSASNIVLLDVTPLTLGIETIGGVMNVVLPRNTPLPAKKSKMFTTIEDNQKMILFEVFEGERTLTKDNHLLGGFELHGIRPAPNGDPQVEVTFEVDVNGILHVTAEDLDTKKKESITITKEKDRLSQQQIDDMIRKAEAASAEDKKLRGQIEARNDLEYYYLSVQSARQNPRAGYDDPKNHQEKEDVDLVIEQISEFLRNNPHPHASQRESESLLKLFKRVSKPLLERTGTSGLNTDDEDEPNVGVEDEDVDEHGQDSHDDHEEL